MIFDDGLSLAAASLAIEAGIGYPEAIFRRFGHPVTWIGAMIAAIDRRCNHDGVSFKKRCIAGIAGLLLLLGVVLAVSVAIEIMVPKNAVGFVILAVLCASLPAQQSLYRHVKDVADALDGDGLAGGRAAVSLIVGRNVTALDTAGVARAAIESLAENFSDGIVAPAFWIGVAGLPGGALYKAINTADSMIGHLTPRYAAFGWAAARLDDLVNLPASRLAALWLVLACSVVKAASPSGAVSAVRRDARKHRSPNAGWPEAAMAGALGLKLAGPRVYGEVMVDDAYMGDGSGEATSHDIRRALKLYRAACLIQFAVIALVAVITLRG